jgi:ribosomal protein L2
MGIRKHKPTSPGQRGRVTTTRKGLHKGKPMRGLTMVRRPAPSRLCMRAHAPACHAGDG